MPLLYQTIRCPRQVLNPEYEIRLLDEITVHEFLTPEDGVEESLDQKMTRVRRQCFMSPQHWRKIRIRPHMHE